MSETGQVVQIDHIWLWEWVIMTQYEVRYGSTQKGYYNQNGKKRDFLELLTFEMSLKMSCLIFQDKGGDNY